MLIAFNCNESNNQARSSTTLKYIWNIYIHIICHATILTKLTREFARGRRFARFQNDWQGGRHPAIADDAADARTFAFRLLCFFAVFVSSWQKHETVHPPSPPIAPGFSMGCKKLQGRSSRVGWLLESYEGQTHEEDGIFMNRHLERQLFFWLEIKLERIWWR